MVDKYKLTRKQNVFLAKKLMVDSIWKSANLEGISVTFPQTDTILKGINVSEIQKLSDILTIINLKRSWQFILDNLDYPIDLNYVCKINQIIGQDIVMDAGNLRKLDVRIGGTDWKPEIPEKEKAALTFNSLNNFENTTERAIETMLYLMRSQLFNDGNKRTAMMAANQIMIQNGAGIISIPINRQQDFVNLLIEFYETNDTDKIKQLVYTDCIEGITFKKDIDINPPEITKSNDGYDI